MIICSCPDVDSAKAIASTLLEKQLVACAQILPQMISMYVWKGQLCQDSEVQLQCKTLNGHFGAIEKTILSLHPYDVPEIIQVPLNNGLADYLKWINDNCPL
ncbi:divalent-cation tolerance protein CutA [Paraferrimonas sp. SM1919]|uniref:divalent-cation tolerance protein CutA n=1 Tax=Paraferrimonas sp. SM1919 TaxID=2662263 RepID=UPI0013D8D04B|nr:divalent-cation tolerance protein CutA [Paraferrimonas sp. SM1919]